MRPACTCRSRLIAVVSFGLLAGVAAAQADEDPLLARSELFAPERARALEPVPMTFAIRSNADEPVTVSCWINVGKDWLFAGIDGDLKGTFNREERTWTWTGTVPARGELRIPFSMIATSWMAGFGRSVGATVGRSGKLVGVTRGAIVEIGERARRGRAVGVLVGGVIVGPTEVTLLLALLVGVVAGTRLRRKLPWIAVPAGIGIFLVLTVAGLLLLDGALTLVADVRILTNWRATPAVVLDAAALYVAPGSGDGVGRVKSAKGSYVPAVALRYDADGASRVGIGFWSNSHVFVSHRAARLVAPFAPGTAVTCWVDPTDPRRFVLTRTPGLGHLGFLALLAVVTVAARFGIRLARVRPSPGDPGTGEPIAPA